MKLHIGIATTILVLLLMNEEQKKKKTTTIKCDDDFFLFRFSRLTKHPNQVAFLSFEIKKFERKK